MTVTKNIVEPIPNVKILRLVQAELGGPKLSSHKPNSRLLSSKQYQFVYSLAEQFTKIVKQFTKTVKQFIKAVKQIFARELHLTRSKHPPKLTYPQVPYREEMPYR